MSRSTATELTLRLGLAFAFLYPAISAWLEPDSWIGYFPAWLFGYLPDPVLLHGFGAIELIIALWLVSGRRVWLPASAALVILVAIIVVNFSQMEVIFRDVSIAALALALIWWHYPAGETESS